MGHHGVRVRGTSLWCDVARAGGTCFVSRADVPLGRGRADRYVATEQTATLAAQLGHPLDEPLLPRFSRPFALGRARLELLPSGRSSGAAQLLVELDGWRGLYAGAVWPSASSGEPAQVRACDELVIDAPEVGDADDDELLERALVTGGRVDDLAVLAALRARFGDRLRLGGAWKRLGVGARGRKADLRVDSVRGTTILAGRRTTDGCLALGLGPTLDEWLALVRDTGARIVWVRARAGQPVEAAMAALHDRGLEAQQLRPPVQLSLFAAPRIKVAR